jgi:16S rRNA (guanine966-N2)-methyltransferase
MGSGKQGQLRIIAGQWRGRKLRFPEVEGLRPTPDRVRETLFNWLAPLIVEARCLDLFSGSGALGLEALSRGAGHCVFVDSSRPVIEAVRAQLRTLGCENADCSLARAEQFLQDPAPGPAFDLVFLDPPFGAGLVQNTARLLELGNWLRTDSHIYLETSLREPLPTLPMNWELKREKAAGDVCSRLFVRLP